MKSCWVSVAKFSFRHKIYIQLHWIVGCIENKAGKVAISNPKISFKNKKNKTTSFWALNYPFTNYLLSITFQFIISTKQSIAYRCDENFSYVEKISSVVPVFLFAFLWFMRIMWLDLWSNSTKFIFEQRISFYSSFLARNTNQYSDVLHPQHIIIEMTIRSMSVSVCLVLGTWSIANFTYKKKLETQISID